MRETTRATEPTASQDTGFGPPASVPYTNDATRAHGRAAFAFIFVTVALDMLALGIMAPVLPKLIIAFEGSAMAEAARMTGVFGFVWAAMQFVCAPTRSTLLLASLVVAQRVTRPGGSPAPAQ